jgi:hypothetical protein
MNGVLMIFNNEKSRKVSMMWVRPALMIYISYAAIGDVFSVFNATSLSASILFLPAIMIGCIIGLARGTRVSIKLGEESGTIVMKSSIIGLLIWGAMVVLRYVAENVIGGIADTSLVAIVLCSLIVLSLSSTIFYTGYLYFRYYRLLQNNGTKDYKVL